MWSVSLKFNLGSYSFLLDSQFLGKCNDLEALVNRERASSGLSALHCDANMRWVAYRHLDDADEGAKQNLAWGDECNLHSWLVKSACCYTSDHENAKCMWSKPFVSFIRPQIYSKNLWKYSGPEWLGRQDRLRNKRLDLFQNERNASHQTVERIIWTLQRDHGKRGLV